MLELKQYQIRALDYLERFFKRCGELKSAKQSFFETTEEAAGFPCEYHSMEGALKDVPYVCLRVPTGGGKTLMACHSIGLVEEGYKHCDNSLVLWLVPTTPILSQTVSALKNPTHPYRQALEATLGNVVVKTIDEALYLSPSDVDNCTCVIVSTMQSFKRDDTTGLRVYKRDGVLMGFFDSSAQSWPGQLELNPITGKPVESLANVIAMRRPIVIVDEAHNARTRLTFETLAGFQPSCIIELTATPDIKVNPSNILYSVSAQELKAEEMVKLPIVVEGRPEWQELLQDAINRRGYLEKLARQEQQKTGEYIRPIMLIQSEKKRSDMDTIHAAKLRDILIQDFRINPDEVKLATGEKDEIDGLDLFKDDCEVRYIITQQKLKEGWDCSFAYVLCSIVESHSKIQVEQILGRILRMPKAKRKFFPELNQSYAFATASFMEIAQNLKDALTQNGFDRQEVERLIQQAPAWQGSDDLFAGMQYRTGELSPEECTVTVNDVSILSAMVERDELEGEVEINPEKGTLNFHEPMTAKDRETLTRHFPEAVPAIEQVFLRTNHIPVPKPSPAVRRLPFAVPELSVVQGDFFDSFEDVLEEYDWSLGEVPEELTSAEYTLSTGEVQRGKIDAGADRITVEFIERVQQESSYWDINAAHNWNVSDLVWWLDKRIEHRDITAREMTAFLTGVILNLQTERNIPLSQLVVDKYKLKAAIENKIRAFRLEARKRAFQQLLSLDGETKLIVSPERCFQYPGEYPVGVNCYNGSYQFKKHYYDIVGGFDGKDGGEEEQCAIFIDQMPEVEYWVRNLDQREHDSFYLQLHNRKCYPDFVAKLKDGRTLVVEYKGADRYSNDDSKEKRIVGEFWAKNSNGQCLFVMTNGKSFDMIVNAIIR